jgi:hypothetical protein
MRRVREVGVAEKDSRRHMGPSKRLGVRQRPSVQAAEISCSRAGIRGRVEGTCSIETWEGSQGPVARRENIVGKVKDERRGNVERSVQHWTAYDWEGS